jgi:hypothetical protein
MARTHPCGGGPSTSLEKGGRPSHHGLGVTPTTPRRATASALRRTGIRCMLALVTSSCFLHSS